METIFNKGYDIGHEGMLICPLCTRQMHDWTQGFLLLKTFCHRYFTAPISVGKQALNLAP